MAKSLSFPNEIKDVYHKIVFTPASSGTDSVPLYRTDIASQNDTEVTTIANLSEITYSLGDGNKMFNLKNYSQDKFTVYSDGSFKMFENSTSGFAETGKIKNINGNLYIGVEE